ncbi:MAG: hypothetical protein HQK72_09715 [Desulfamplus sp.]|nr:hypothetical protein [Desulfamplus sp.]
MTTEIITDKVAEPPFNSIDIDAILKIALQERDSMLSESPLLREFQQDIDKTVNRFEDVTQRLESLALAARTFNIKREIPDRIAEIETKVIIFRKF